MATCPKCGREMVKAETERTVLVAGEYARLIGLTGSGPMEQTVHLKVGTLYCPTCTRPAPAA